MAPVLGILFLLLVGGIFIYWCALPAKAKVVAPPPEPEPAPEPPPPLSCLALGIIKSLDEEPDAWNCFVPGFVNGRSNRFYTHSATKTVVKHVRYCIVGFLDVQIVDNIYVENAVVPQHEADSIVAAINRRNHLLAKREADAKAKEAAPRLEYFNKLGCPEGGAK